MVECGRLLHRIQEWGDNQLTCKMCVQILGKYLQRVLFPSNIKLYFCPFSDLSLVCLKDNPLKILRLLFGTPFTLERQERLLPLSPGHSLTLLFQADTAELSAVTDAPRFSTLFCTLCRRQFSERLQSKCFVVNSWTLSLCGFFWSLQKWTI